MVVKSYSSEQKGKNSISVSNTSILIFEVFHSGLLSKIYSTQKYFHAAV